MTVMKDMLDIDDSHDGRAIAIGWFNTDEGLEGDLHLGESFNGDGGDDDVEHGTVSDAVRSLADEVKGGWEFAWWSMKTATVALSVARARLREVRSRKSPLKGWERQALEAGWKPPKGRL